MTQIMLRQSRGQDFTVEVEDNEDDGFTAVTITIGESRVSLFLTSLWQARCLARNILHACGKEPMAGEMSDEDVIEKAGF